MSKISKRIASEDREEGEVSDGVDPSPSREYKLQVAGQAPARSRDPIKKFKDNSRAERTVKARAKSVEEGIEIGKRESAEKIEDQNTQIKEPARLPTQSSRRRVPSSQAAKMLLIAGCCLQSPCLPGRTGVNSISPMIRSSSIQVRAVVSYRRE